MKLKRVPSSINILGRKYKTKLLSRDKIVKAAMVDDAIASVEHKTKTIHLCKEDDDVLCTIFHEVMHVVQYVTGIDQILSPELQEILCESTANGIMDTLKSMELQKIGSKRK